MTRRAERGLDEDGLGRHTSPIDSRVLFVVVTLVLIGLTVVYSATQYKGFVFLKGQLLRAAVGFVALAVAVQFRHTVLGRRIRWVLLGTSIAVLASTLAVGIAAGVARRWLHMYFVSFQPAEIVKFVLIIWLAAYFADLRKSGKPWNFWISVAKPGIPVLTVVCLTLAQPAVGTSIIMALACLALFFVVGVKLRYLALVLLGVALILVLAYRFIPHARSRVDRWANGQRYHQYQSLIAIGSGGPVGKGLGEGKQKYYFLPKLHNDFIFAEIGEEFGFLGSVGVILLYLLLFLRGIQISREATGNLGQYLAAGITMVFFLYALVHIAVTLGLIPTTGQPLPFVSFGGSALVTNLFAAGILLNISRFRRTRMKVRQGFYNWNGNGHRAVNGIPGGW